MAAGARALAGLYLRLVAAFEGSNEQTRWLRIMRQGLSSREMQIMNGSVRGDVVGAVRWGEGMRIICERSRNDVSNVRRSTDCQAT